MGRENNILLEIIIVLIYKYVYVAISYNFCHFGHGVLGAKLSNKRGRRAWILDKGRVKEGIRATRRSSKEVKEINSHTEDKAATDVCRDLSDCCYVSSNYYISNKTLLSMLTIRMYLHTGYKSIYKIISLKL